MTSTTFSVSGSATVAPLAEEADFHERFHDVLFTRFCCVFKVPEKKGSFSIILAAVRGDNAAKRIPHTGSLRDCFHPCSDAKKAAALNTTAHSLSLQTVMKSFSVLLYMLLPLSVASAELTIWPVSQLKKVFRDTTAEHSKYGDIVRFRVARNEYESAQVAIRCTAPTKCVRFSFGKLVHESTGYVIEKTQNWNFVGFIPIKQNTPHSERIQLRKAPCEIPDPLLASCSTLDLPANTSQPVWLNVFVPKDAPPGTYRGTVAAIAGEERKELQVELIVDPFTLPDKRHLYVTHWFSASRVAKAHKVELWSEPFWRILQHYASLMANHRQNVVHVPWSLIHITHKPDSSLTFDYSLFDKYIGVFQQSGVSDRIEISHVCRFGPHGWSGSEIVFLSVAATDAKSGKRMTLDGKIAIPKLLADLQRHLQRRGWIDKAMIHVADEPSINNAASWREKSAIVHEAAPQLKRIDAIEGIGFSGELEVWVPKLSHFDRWRSAYEARRDDNEFWFYICCHPYGNIYPNRFLDFPLSDMRVLHWINFRANLDGYLHWAIVSWSGDAYGAPRTNLPPGDTHIIYPASQGPTSSIRWDVQRDSIEDFEYLCLLAANTEKLKQRFGKAADWVRPKRRAMELCRRVVPNISNIARDPATILEARAAVRDEIRAIDSTLPALVETEPAEGSVLVDGPIAIELYGVTAPGANVTVNGKAVTVSPDGNFVANCRPQGNAHTVNVVIEHNGQERQITRSLQIQR